MKKVYEVPVFSVVKFETEDIVRTSGLEGVSATKEFNSLSLSELLSLSEQR